MRCSLLTTADRVVRQRPCGDGREGEDQRLPSGSWHRCGAGGGQDRADVVGAPPRGCPDLTTRGPLRPTGATHPLSHAIPHFLGPLLAATALPARRDPRDQQAGGEQPRRVLANRKWDEERAGCGVSCTAAWRRAAGIDHIYCGYTSVTLGVAQRSLASGLEFGDDAIGRLGLTF